MSLICFASAKGSPGVTLTSLAVAATLAVRPDRKVLLLEADRSGGSLAVRYQLPRQPGLITLAAAGHHGLTRDELWNHAQELPGGLGVIVAPEREDRIAPILADGGKRLGRWLADLPDIDVVADCGRIDSKAIDSGLVSQADRVYLLARPRAEEIQPGAALAARARQLDMDVEWLLIGDRPHDPVEVAEVTGVPVAAILPDDSRGAEAILEGRSDGRGNRGRLARAIQSFAIGIDNNDQPGPSEGSPGSDTEQSVAEPLHRASALVGKANR